MTALSARQLDWRARWRPRVLVDDCTHASPRMYLPDGDHRIVLVCRLCGLRLADPEQRCSVLLLAAGRRCLGPGRYNGRCRAHHQWGDK